MATRLDAELLITAGVNGLSHLERLINSIEEAGGDTEQLREAAEQLRNEWDNLTTQEQADRLRHLSNAANQSARDMGLLGQQAQQTTSTFDHLKSSAMKLGAALGLTFVADKVKDFLGGAISGAADFEQQLATVQSVSKATVQEMEQIKAKSEELGKSTHYNATQAAEGFEILARAGLDTKESLDTIPSVLALAQGNGLELAEAAGFITNAVQGMGLSFDQAGRVADVLSQAAASANTNVQGMGAALSYAAPSAAALGLSIEETASYIGKFADAGIDASRAGTSFNAMLSQFGNNTSSFRRELKNIGITTNDFNEAITQLAASGSRGQVAITALGQEAGPALKALLSQGIGPLNELRSKLDEAGGAAQSQADVMNNTWQGMKASLGSAWDYLKNTLGESFLEPMSRDFQRLSDTIINLVDSGKVKQLGDSLANAFSEGSTALIDYINNLDMSATVDKVSNSIDTLSQMGTAANGAYQALSITVNAVKAGVLTIGSVIAGATELYTKFVQTFIDGGRALGDAFDIDTKALDEVSAAMTGITQKSAEFRSFAAEEISKASESMGASLDSIAGKSNDTASAINDTAQTTLKASEEMASAFGKILNWAQSTGAGTDEQMKMVRSSVLDMLESFDRPEQFADLLLAIQATGQEALVGADLMKLMGDAAALGSDKAKQAAEQAQTAIANLGGTAEQQAARTQEAIQGTFEALNIDVQQSLTGVNSKTQQTFDLIASGASSVADSSYSAAEKTKLLADLFAQGLNAAKTKEEFIALNEISQQYGLTAVATAEQTKILQAGMKGGADAVKQAIQSQTEATTANTKANTQNTQSSQQVASAKDQQAQATDKATAAEQEANTTASTSLGYMQQVVGTIKEKISAIEGVEASTEQTNAVWNSFLEDMNFDNRQWLGLQEFTHDMRRVDEVINKQIASFDNARNKAIAMTQALGSGAVSSRDLAQAQHALRQATDASINGIIRMDSQTLSNLQNAIDDARQRMQGLADDAKNTADELEATLAKMRGNDDKAREIEQTKKLAEIESKLNEARERGNQEEIKQLERALQLQKQINIEETKQAKERERESANRTNSTTTTTTNVSQNTSNQPSSNSPDISASDVADAWDERIAQAEKNAVNKFAEDLITQAKMRAN